MSNSTPVTYFRFPCTPCFAVSSRQMRRPRKRYATAGRRTASTNRSTSWNWRNNFVSTQNSRMVIAIKTLAAADPDYGLFLKQHQELSFTHISPAVESELEHDLLA